MNKGLFLLTMSCLSSSCVTEKENISSKISENISYHDIDLPITEQLPSNNKELVSLFQKIISCHAIYIYANFMPDESQKTWILSGMHPKLGCQVSPDLQKPQRNQLIQILKDLKTEDINIVNADSEINNYHENIMTFLLKTKNGSFYTFGITNFLDFKESPKARMQGSLAITNLLPDGSLKFTSLKIDFNGSILNKLIDEKNKGIYFDMDYEFGMELLNRKLNSQ